MLILMVGKDQQPQPRHRIYLVALILTILAIVVTYLIELSRNQADPFNLVALPLLALLLSLLAARAQPALGRRWFLRRCGTCLFRQARLYAL
jgi:lipopolysaccharide export LptBFGC system permease protein LptF